MGLVRFDECDTLWATTEIEKCSATRNCPFRGAEQLLESAALGRYISRPGSLQVPDLLAVD
jgi:hypothetical protein